MSRQTINRYLIYTAGTVFLAAGITLNTKTDLGVSSLISLPYSISEIWNLSFPVLTFFMYAFFVLLQFVLKGKNRQKRDILQLPFAFAFSFLLEVCGSGYDMLTDAWNLRMEGLVVRSVMLIIAIAMTGAGVSMMVSMTLIPNPADGLADAIGTVLGKNVGFGKNLLDITTVGITCAVGILASGHLVGVGIGTVMAMLGVGRCVAAFDFLFRDKMLLAAGAMRSTHVTL